MFSVKQKMLIARALNRSVVGLRRLAGAPARVRCRRSGIEWDLDLDEGIDLSIYLLGAYEPRLLRSYRPLLRAGDVVWDIGANIGAHTLHFARLVGPTGRVFAFEPTDFAFAKLRINAALNPNLAPRIDARNLFLVDQAEVPPPPTVFASWPVGPHAAVVDPEHFGRPMQLSTAHAVTGDDFAKAVGLDRLDLVKLDVDGHELPVLRGLRATLARLRPRLMVEVAPFVLDRLAPDALAEMLTLLRDAGYRFSLAGRALPLDEASIRRRAGPGGSLNILLEP